MNECNSVGLELIMYMLSWFLQEDDPERDSISAIVEALTDLGLHKVLTSLNLS